MPLEQAASQKEEHRNTFHYLLQHNQSYQVEREKKLELHSTNRRRKVCPHPLSRQHLFSSPKWHSSLTLPVLDHHLHLSSAFGQDWKFDCINTQCTPPVCTATHSLHSLNHSSAFPQTSRAVVNQNVCQELFYLMLSHQELHPQSLGPSWIAWEKTLCFQASLFKKWCSCPKRPL